MRLGVICEGHTDRVVISNVLKGIHGIDSSQIDPLRPQDSLDETDIANLPEEYFSNWSIVKSECESREKIRKFLTIEGNDFVIIHIDSAEADEYGIVRPSKDHQYCKILRERIKNQIKDWMMGEFEDEIICAITVEEIEAWILTIFEQRNSCQSADPKERLKKVLARNGTKFVQSREFFNDITRPFTKKKNFTKYQFTTYNDSLNEFCLEVLNKLPEQIL